VQYSNSIVLKHSRRFDSECSSTTVYNRLRRLRDLSCCGCLDAFVVVDSRNWPSTSK
jgi:hypothetical protein